MNDTLNYDEVPNNYLRCIHNTCPHQERCLRYTVARCTPDTVPSYPIVNPQYISGKEDTCDVFRSNQKVKFAYGITHILDNVPYKTAIAIRKELYQELGRNMFYRVLNKERPLYPDEQEEIAALLRQHGIVERPEFDRYAYEYDW